MSWPPTDREIERAGQRYSERAQSAALAKTMVTHDELLELIVTYPDGEAHELLGKLRERFWASDQVNDETNTIIGEMRESDGEP